MIQNLHVAVVTTWESPQQQLHVLKIGNPHDRGLCHASRKSRGVQREQDVQRVLRKLLWVSICMPENNSGRSEPPPDPLLSLQRCYCSLGSSSIRCMCDFSQVRLAAIFVPLPPGIRHQRQEKTLHINVSSQTHAAVLQYCYYILAMPGLRLL